MNQYDNILISIITPVYNAENYISKAIESVKEQTHKNWEMILIDDCSIDNSEVVIQKYLTDLRIHYLKMEKNSGGARARNKGLEIAKGKIIAFLDADDQWKPEKLEKQLMFMLNNHYAFTFTSYEILGQKENKIVQVPHKLSYSDFMKNTIIGTLTVMINTNIVGPIRLVDVQKDHDSMTWAELLKRGYFAYGMNESLAYYRKVPGSISNNKFRAVKNHWNNCRRIQKISFFKCTYYFIFYLFNAIKKHYC